jgi:hypothetical protein
MKPDNSAECEICAHLGDEQVCEECINHSHFRSIDEDTLEEEWGWEFEEPETDE